MQKKHLILLVACLALMISLGTVIAQDEGTEINIAWPYSVPPDGHFNSYASGAINLGGNTYQDLMEPPLAVYLWSQGTYEGMLAESFGPDADGNYVVTLKSGVTWSDGTPVTSQDIVTTWSVGYMIGWIEWTDIASIEVVDDLTAKFNMDQLSPLTEYRILTRQIRPTSVYGDIGSRAQPLAEAGTAAGDTTFDALLTELTEFRPETYVSAGPYVMLPENVSDANVVLVRNEGGLNADIVRFDRAVVWNGETEQVTPLVQNGDLWYATHGFPPATEAAFVEQGIDIIRGPSYSGPSLIFNHTVAPFDRVEVRQALAYAIDREQNGFVSLGESGIAVECMCGFSDNLTGLWLSEETLDGLNAYDYDPEMAASILEGIGFTRGDDGVWLDDQGNRMAFELIFPAEFLDWAAAAENVTQQLNDFGFEITARGVQFQQQVQDVYDSNFQLAIRQWGAASPFPGQSYLVPFFTLNGQGELAGEGVGGGMNFDNNVTYSGGDINVYDVALESGVGLDVEAQKAAVEQLAWAYNELLPAIPLWERYGNNPLNREFLDAPASDDPIYNNAGADHFMPYLIMTGQIGPVGS